MRSKTRQIALTAVFVAIILFMHLFRFAMIPLGLVNVTILCVPVIIGTILLGLVPGLILGACFGAISVMSAFGSAPSALVAPLVAGSPALTLVLCLLPRLLVPVSTSLSYRLFSRGQAIAPKAVPFAAVIGSLTNTLFYLGFMLLLYAWLGLGARSLLGPIALIALTAGGPEALVAGVITSPVVYAIWKAQRQL